MKEEVEAMFDRILVSFGDDESISKHLRYLESLDIHEVPKKTPQYSGNSISIWFEIIYPTINASSFV